MIIEFTLARRRLLPPRTFLLAPKTELHGRPPRIARLLALAHKLERLVRSGEIKDYAELARLGQISPARLSQIMLLAQLAPEIQEYVLFLSAHEGCIAEAKLRAIVREPRWDRQRALFEQFLAGSGQD
jgi:hypothetical protein